MSAPFLSELKIIAFNFPPKGWAFCNGQLMQISQNQALFSLLGTTYGGDGRQTYGLPNLQGRVPMHMGNRHTLGERGGEENHTLTASEMPSHTHSANVVASTGDTPIAAGHFPANSGSVTVYAPPPATTALHPSTISGVGGQPHENREPFLTLNFCIALQGIFPSRN